MLPVIPQELSDMILDFLHDDVATLCSAGLVCKSWVPTSRFHLFSEVLFSPWYGTHVFELMRAEYSTVPPYVRSLNISGSSDVNFVRHVDETIRRLPLLSNLKTLHLVDINMTILTLVAKKKLTALLQNLTTLNLYCCKVRNYFSLYLDSFATLEQFETVNQAIDFIAAAQCLEDITLEGVHCSESCNYSSQAIVPPLRRIMFRTPLDNIMDWICRCHPTPSVRSLEIRRIDKDNEITIICKFIRHLGSALENLAIACLDSDWIGEIQSKCISEALLYQSQFNDFYQMP